MTTLNGIAISKDVLSLIFSLSDTPSLQRCCKVSKAFRQVILDKQFLKTRFPNAEVFQGESLEKWFLRVIHSQDDLLKVVKCHVSKAPSGRKTVLEVVSSLKTVLKISYSPGFKNNKAHRDKSEHIWVASGVLPLAADNITNIFTQGGWWPLPSQHSILFQQSLLGEAELADKIFTILQNRTTILERQEIAIKVVSFAALTAFGILVKYYV